MLITVQCPSCNHLYDLDDALIGRQVRCKRCGNVFEIQPPPPSAITIDDAVSDDPFAALQDSAPPAPLSDSLDSDLFAEAPFKAVPERPPEEKPSARKSPPVSANSFDLPANAIVLSPGAYTSSRRQTKVGATPFILLAFFGLSVLIGIAATARLMAGPGDSQAIAHVWLRSIVGDALFFALVGPAVLLGIFVTAKIFNFSPINFSYLRACAVATLPMLVFQLAGVISDGMWIGLMVVAALPLTFLLVKHIFDLEWLEGLIGFLCGGAFCTLAIFIVAGILSAVAADPMATLDNPTAAAPVTPESVARADHPMPKPASFNFSQSPTPSATPATPAIPAPGVPTAAATEVAQPDTTLAQLRETVSQKVAMDLSQLTREEVMPEAAALKDQVEALRKQFESNPQWQELAGIVETFSRKAAALPSGKLDPAIFTDPPAADDWTTAADARGQLAEEVSFKQFKFRPPTDARLDLRSSEDGPSGLVWHGISNPAISLSLSVRPRNDDKQRRPVVTDKPAVIRIADAGGLLIINAANVSASYGCINGITFSRITSGITGEQTMQYIAPAGDQWLIIEFSPIDASPLANEISASIRTLRLAAADEPRANPFAARLVAPRLADDFEHAQPLLRDAGAAAEDAVAAQLESTDAVLCQRALELLADIGTAKSLPAVAKAAIDPNPTIAALARDILKKLKEAPAGAARPAAANDLIAQILADLSSPIPARRKEAVAKLVVIAPDDKQRSAVAARLIKLLRDRDTALTLADITPALLAWADATAVPLLEPLLDPRGDADRRHLAMKVLGQIKDHHGAILVSHLLQTDPAATTESLLAMGPVAEDTLFSALHNANPQVRGNAARILQDIGTSKSIPELTHAALDRRDKPAAAIALTALEAVKARAAAEPGK